MTGHGQLAGGPIDDRRLAGLRRQWLLVAVAYLAVLGGGYAVMLRVWPPPDAARWLLLASATMLVQMVVLWWALQFNHRPDEAALFRTIGVANGMTLARGLLTCLMAGFLFGPQPLGVLAWAPAILYMAERVIDFFDGFVARYTRRETKLGGILDIEFDGLGILIAVGLGIQYGRLPAWYLILGLGRQLFVLGMWIRTRLGKPNYDMTASDHRRVIAGIQTSFIAVVLWPIWTVEVAMFAAWLFAVPLVLSFVRDWLVVSGVLDPASDGYRRARRDAKRIVERWLPLAARVGGAVLVVMLLWPLAASAQWGAWAILLAGLATLCFLLGVLSRVAALAIAFLAGFNAVSAGLNLDNALLLACAVLVLHTGGGMLALWQPEEYYVHAKLGTRDEAGV
ncbi:MAG: CDP-alcohol phosphatidyltransferase family protein [Caldilinea sp.]|nr:CDP-alcohol phosphatidyltransferase family protein [Caldilinea sp.]MCW5841220.1 CDP-alcohol phosphatidyltransferase family protein [Caldilinea sp.]